MISSMPMPPPLTAKFSVAHTVPPPPYPAAASSTAHIANVPGHVAGCHGRRRGLGNGIDNRVFDQRRESVRNAQSVHRKDQLISADLLRWSRLDLVSPHNFWRVECPHSEEDQYDRHDQQARKTLKTHPIIIILQVTSKKIRHTCTCVPLCSWSRL